MAKLERGDPVKIAVFGGSITRAHGVANDEGWAYQLQEILNKEFPTGEGKARHLVVNLAVHGANICYCACATIMLHSCLNPLCRNGSCAAAFVCVRVCVCASVHGWVGA